MAKACTFHDNCRKVAGPEPSTMCPRHQTLTDLLGREKTLRVEFGVQCSGCFKNFDEDEVEQCSHCRVLDICKNCMEKHNCRSSEAEELESEADELEAQAGELREAAQRIRMGTGK